MAFRVMSPASRWGQVVGNLVSQWTQILGLVLMTKRLIEIGSRKTQDNQQAQQKGEHQQQDQQKNPQFDRDKMDQDRQKKSA
jgi:hypothetical protein